VLEQGLPPSATLGILAALAASNVGLGVVFAGAKTQGVALAVLPAILLVIGSLIASNRAILIFAAIAINLFSPIPLTDALPLHGAIQIYPSDILVVLAVASWCAAWLMNPEDERPSLLGTRLLGWPLLLFGAILVITIVRGHERYGEKLVSVPLRFLVYAGIALAVTDLKPRDAYRWLVWLFYAGTLWQSGVAVYGYATGTSVTAGVALSTGGERVLAGSTAIFMAGALLLALLNVELDRPAGRTSLHLAMAGLAMFALVSTYQRTTFAALGLLVPLLFLAFRRIGLRTVAFLPLAAPLLVLAALLVPRADPTLFRTFADRVTASPTSDTSAEWRRKAIAAVWTQVQESPITGVGFGRVASFQIGSVRTTITQDPHNQFIYLWAGGGLLLLGSFVLLLLVYLIESWRRFVRGTLEERRLIFWAVSVWFVFIVNSATGPTITSPSLLLAFWIFMVLPMIVRPGQARPARGRPSAYA
jgi:O-antigen ligase